MCTCVLPAPIRLGPCTFFSHTCRLGFFITTPAAEAQLELDLAEQRCPLDASADRENLYLTLFTFDALDVNYHNVTREFRLAEMLQVRRVRAARGMNSGHGALLRLRFPMTWPRSSRAQHAGVATLRALRKEDPDRHALAGLWRRRAVPVLRKLRAGQPRQF